MKAVAIGVRSLRATIVPLVMIWGFSAVVVFAYYAVSPAHRYFELLRWWHEQHGVIAVLMDRTVFCGLVPALFMLAVRELRQRYVMRTCALQVAWSCLWGYLCNAGFHLQAHLFGNGIDWLTLALKTSVDQFVLTPLLISPANAVFCFWLARDQSFRRTRAKWPARFFRDLVAPNLLANWCVSVPVTLMMFVFPTEIQIHVNSLNCAFAMLLFLQIGKRTS